jgi:hypothetical protein
MTRWYYTLDNRNRLGPVTSEQLQQLALAGTIRPESMVIPESGGKWVPATKLKGLFPKTAPRRRPSLRSSSSALDAAGRSRYRNMS